VDRVRSFVVEAWAELKKVVWPNRNQIRDLTAAVLAVAIAAGVYIFALDWIFSTIVRFLAG
jgi:preprotein translocase subunit SecE